MSMVSIKHGTNIQRLTWDGDSSATTTISNSFRLSQITVTYDAPVTNDCIISTVSRDTDYNTVIATANNGRGTSDNYFVFTDAALFPVGHEITIACNATGATAYCEVYYM